MNFWFGRAAPLEQAKQQARACINHDIIETLVFCGCPINRMEREELLGFVCYLIETKHPEIKFALEKQK